MTAKTGNGRILPRFGLKLIFCLVAVVGIVTAWLLQPQATCSVIIDLTEFNNRYQRATATAGAQELPWYQSPIQDHAIRLRTPRIINNAFEASPELKSFAESNAKAVSQIAMEWVYERMQAVPVDDHQIRLTVSGDASDRIALRSLVKTLAESYIDFLGAGPPQATDHQTGAEKPPVTIKNEPDRWRVKWSFE